MELSSLSQNIVTVPYERGGESIELSVNIDAFTPEFFRSVGSRFKGKMKELEAQDKKQKGKKKLEPIEFFEIEARSLEIYREIHADLLSSGVLTAWTVEVDGMPIAPTREILIKQPPRFVEELWELCLKAAKTVKKRGDVEETSESTHDGSRANLALAPTG